MRLLLRNQDCRLFEGNLEERDYSRILAFVVADPSGTIFHVVKARIDHPWILGCICAQSGRSSESQQTR